MYRSLAFLMLITAAVSEKTFALQPAVPVHQEPRHRLVLERDRSRVLDVLIVPGDTTLYHIHAQPIFYISLGFGPGEEQVYGKDWADTEAWGAGNVASNMAYAEEPRTHRVTNTGKKPSRLIGITNEGPGQDAGPDETVGLEDKPEIENRWFRSYRFTLDPGESTGQHRHSSPVLVVQVTEGGYEIVEQGKTATKGDEAGSWSWLEAGLEHQLHNQGQSKIEIVEVEVR
jgi:quercetin dioxygenase-like cupin family protein